MDSNILNELFARSNKLEEENNRLKNSVEKSKEELKRIIEDLEKEENNKELSSDESERKIFFILVMEIDENKSVQPHLNLSAHTDSSKILENLFEVTITYTSLEQSSNIWIMGDFTDWEAKPMSKLKDSFVIKFVLIKGFKYYYCFTARDEITIDFTSLNEINPRNEQVNNYVSNNINDIPFDYKLHGNLLNSALINYTKAKMENKDELSYLENAVKTSIEIKEKYENVLKEREETKLKFRKYYE